MNRRSSFQADFKSYDISWESWNGRKWLKWIERSKDFQRWVWMTKKEGIWVANALRRMVVNRSLVLETTGDDASCKIVLDHRTGQKFTRLSIKTRRRWRYLALEGDGDGGWRRMCKLLEDFISSDNERRASSYAEVVQKWLAGGVFNRMDDRSLGGIKSIEFTVGSNVDKLELLSKCIVVKVLAPSGWTCLAHFLEEVSLSAGSREVGKWWWLDDDLFLVFFVHRRGS